MQWQITIQDARGSTNEHELGTKILFFLFTTNLLAYEAILYIYTNV